MGPLGLPMGRLIHLAGSPAVDGNPMKRGLWWILLLVLVAGACSGSEPEERDFTDRRSERRTPVMRDGRTSPLEI